MNEQPTKKFKNIVAVIRIIDPVTEKTESKFIRAIDDTERRAWLLKTIMRALLNGKIAEVVNKEDDKDE